MPAYIVPFVIFLHCRQYEISPRAKLEIGISFAKRKKIKTRGQKQGPFMDSLFTQKFPATKKSGLFKSWNGKQGYFDPITSMRPVIGNEKYLHEPSKNIKRR